MLGGPGRFKAVAAGIALVVMGAALALQLSGRRVSTVRAQSESQPPKVQTPAAPAVARITVGASIPASPDGIAAACKLPSSNGEADWKRWASFDGAVIGCASDSETLPAYAAKYPDGLAICAVNHGDQKATFNLGVRLEAGVYSIERLPFELESGKPAVAAERLEPVVLAKSGEASKPGWLQPGMGAVYRFVNRTSQVSRRYWSVEGYLHDLAPTHRDAVRLMRTPLIECQYNVDRIALGVPESKRYDLLKYVHRALFTLAHAQALCRNCRQDGRLSAAEASKLESSLNALEESLAELSAACLVLVPDFSVTVPDSATPNMKEVTIAVTNRGASTVSLVRIGASAPRGARVTPEEQAMFQSLGPGQTVRAKFTVRTTESDNLAGLIADIAYFAARTPAHLRLRPV